MAKYLLTNKAVEDLSKIYEYTFEFWSEHQADKYYFELIEYFEILAENANIGKSFEEVDPNIFRFLANKLLIFYRILNSDEIEIERILGADMDLKNRFAE